MSKTTVKDFKLFENEFRKWIDMFGLKGWQIRIIHKFTEDNAKAEIWFNQQGDRVTLVRLGKNWDNDPVNDHEIKKTAFHEAMELFLRRMVYLAYERSVRDIEIEEEKHNIIRTLENVLFDNFKED